MHWSILQSFFNETQFPKDASETPLAMKTIRWRTSEEDTTACLPHRMMMSLGRTLEEQAGDSGITCGLFKWWQEITKLVNLLIK